MVYFVSLPGDLILNKGQLRDYLCERVLSSVSSVPSPGSPAAGEARLESKNTF